MGYEMPNVEKEIYLPAFDGWGNDGLTFEQYKEKYGIDIEEIFNITSDPDLSIKNNLFAKIYLVGNYYAFHVGLLSRIIGNPDEQHPNLFRVAAGDKDCGFGLDIDIVARTIKYNEI